MGQGSLIAPNTNNGLRYDEMADFHVKFDGEVQEAIRVCQVPFNRKKDFNTVMLPQCAIGNFIGLQTISKFDATNTTGPNPIPAPVVANRYELKRFDPHRHPDYPQLLAVQSEEVQGYGVPALDANNKLIFVGNDALTSMGYCRIALTYKATPWQPARAGITDDVINVAAGGLTPIYETCRYTALDAKGSAKNLVLGGAQFLFPNPPPNPPNLCPAQGTMTVPTLHLTYTWYMCPLIPPTAYSLQGCVNAFPFDTTDRGLAVPYGNFAVGTVLYLHFDTSKTYYTSLGNPVVDVTYHFLYLGTGHNFLLRQDKGAFGVVYRRVGAATLGGRPSNDPLFRWPPGYNIYDYADLNALFCILK